MKYLIQLYPSDIPYQHLFTLFLRFFKFYLGVKKYAQRKTYVQRVLKV